MSTNESPTPEESSQRPTSARDSRMDSFLRQAAPILAAERGLNETSRLKLQALAEELHLPQALYDRAVSELSRSGQLSQLTRMEQHFAQFLDQEMGKLSGGILSAQTESKAIQIAESKYQLAPQRARDIIRQQAVNRGIQRVSQSEAERYLENLCRDMLRGTAIPDDDQKTRIGDFGKQWGLNADQCDAILQRVVATNANLRRPLRVGRLISFAAVATVLVGAAIVSGIFFFRQTEQLNPASKTAAPSNSVITRPQIQHPDWWTGELYQSVVRTCETQPNFRDNFLAAAANNPETRQLAYSQLSALSGDHSPDLGVPLPSIVAALITCEPNNTIAQTTIEQWRRQLAPGDSLDLTRPATVKAAERAADLMFELWKANATTQLRDQAQSLLADAYGVYIDADEELSQLETKLVAARCSLFWNHLIDKAWSNPLDAVALFKHLHEKDPSNHAQARQAVLAILDANASQWTVLQADIDEFIKSDNNDDLLIWLEWIDGEKEPELAQWLVDAIAKRLQLPLSNRDLATKISLVRATLMPEPVGANELKKRWDLVRRTKALLIDHAANESLPIAQKIANATYIATLAIILQSCERTTVANFSTFDELIAADVRKLSMENSPAANETIIAYRQVSKPATAIERQQLDRAIERLADTEASKDARRQALTSMANVGDRFGDVSYDDAMIIAQFILAIDNAADLVEIEHALKQIRHWPNLSLAWLDSMESTRVSADHAFQIFASLFGEPAQLENQSSWRVELRMLTLRRMSEAIDATLKESADSPWREWHKLGQYIGELLEIRVRTQDSHGSSNMVSDPYRRSALLIESRFEKGLARVVFLEELLADSLAVNPMSHEKSIDRALGQRLLDAELQITEQLLLSHREEPQ